MSVSDEVALLDLVRTRVRRGVAWLKLKAPDGWQRRLLDIGGDGKVHLRAEGSDNTVLALAFEPNEEFASIHTGYVSQETVVSYHSLKKDMLMEYGFNVPQGDDYDTLLADVWLEALTSYAKPPHDLQWHRGAMFDA